MFSSRVIQRTFWTVARLSFKTATGLSVISYQLSVISINFPTPISVFFLFTFGSSRVLDSGKFLPGGKSGYPQDVQAEILAKVEAFERFVTLNALALGLLQVLSLELPKTIWADFPRWFPTLPCHGFPIERIALLARQHPRPSLFPAKPTQSTFA